MVLEQTEKPVKIYPSGISGWGNIVRWRNWQTHKEVNLLYLGIVIKK
jgi:hypothetical protein